MGSRGLGEQRSVARVSGMRKCRIFSVATSHGFAGPKLGWNCRMGIPVRVNDPVIRGD